MNKLMLGEGRWLAFWPLIAALWLAGFSLPVAAATLTSPNYRLDANIGSAFGGPASSADYKLFATGGEGAAGSAASGSYKLGYGYVATLTQSISLSVQPSGLLAYYPFDENTGARVNDFSPNGNSLDTTAAPSWAAGKVGQAMSFNGSSQDAWMTATGAMLPQTFTVEAWVKLAATGLDQSVFSIGQDPGGTGWLLGIGTDNKPYFSSNASGTLIGTSVLTAGTWYHLSATLSGPSGSLKLYVNGAQEATTATTGSISYDGWGLDRLEIASAKNPVGGSVKYLSGTIDEAKLFNRALTPGEIKADYDAAVLGVPAGLAFSSALVSGVSQTLGADAVVQTDAPAYDLSIRQDKDLTSGSNTIPAVNNGGTIAAPAAWTEGTTKGLGFTITAGIGVPAKWGTSPNFNYAAVPAADSVFYSRSGFTGGSKEVLNLQFRVDVPGNQPQGDYQNTVTYSATLKP